LRQQQQMGQQQQRAVKAQPLLALMQQGPK
jgi:hypothetical protein